jgi:hypothetical protein
VWTPQSLPAFTMREDRLRAMALLAAWPSSGAWHTGFALILGGIAALAIRSRPALGPHAA